MKPVSKEAPQQTRVKKGRWTCCLIFLPLIGTILVMSAFVVLVGAAGVLSDRTFELQRGSFWHRMLIDQPLSDYPDDLVPGTIRYYYSSGEVGPSSTSVVIETAQNEAEAFTLARTWLETKGFKIQSGGSRTDRQFRHPNGQTANLRYQTDKLFIEISDPW